MTTHSASFESTGDGLALSNAILLYQPERSGTASPYDAPRSKAAAFASIHAVEPGCDGQPVIGAGTPLTRAHLRRWADALGRGAPPEILPPNVIVAHQDVLAWWVPAQIRPGYFALSSRTGLVALAERTIKPVPYPAHLFVATRSGLGVYALPTSERPTAETEVLHSPILNVFIDGRLCLGNIAKPKTLTPASIPEYERAVFDSWSTHPNPGQELTVTGKGGLVRLWDALAKRSARTFPVRRLRPFAFDARARRGTSGRKAPAVTVGKLIAMGASR